jgi:hypothetical protein
MYRLTVYKLQQIYYVVYDTFTNLCTNTNLHISFYTGTFRGLEPHIKASGIKGIDSVTDGLVSNPMGNKRGHGSGKDDGDIALTDRKRLDDGDDDIDNIHKAIIKANTIAYGIVMGNANTITYFILILMLILI